ncbi:MAG: hypothetical protein GY951_10620, partial [Psychromonas sp.]|nr:hypothetical protein [Psychromonas sp.]
VSPLRVVWKASWTELGQRYFYHPKSCQGFFIAFWYYGVSSYEKSTDNQVLIVHAIWQHRDSSTISFLSKLLSSDTEVLWQEALDGLITIGGNDSLLALNNAKQLLSTNNVKVRFINEAIGLINGV